MTQLVKETRIRLEDLSEPKYQKFSARLIPGIDNLIGVRLPKIRKIAKEIVRQGYWQEYLEESPNLYFEETMLQGMIIGELKEDIEVVLALIQSFVPKIDNWSVCDSFCNSLKIIKLHREHVWEFITPYFDSDKAYDIRFAVVVLIFYYIDEEYIDDVLAVLDRVHHNDYYVKMAVAWTVSICFINLPERTMRYLMHNNLDDNTYNKALRKICESLCVDKETKATIRGMKRK